MLQDVVIVSAARTPIGSMNGALSTVSAVELGKTAVLAALGRASLAPEEVDEVILGHVLTAGLGQNTARQTAIAARVPETASAMTVNQVCGSGLRAVALAAQAIQCGDARIIVAGGQENMSQSRHAIHLRSGIKMGDASLTDTMIKDGLWDAFNDYHMGMTAENIVSKYAISRQMQDEFALHSQQKAVAANEAGRFSDEIVPVVVSTRKGDITVNTDEGPRADTCIEKLAKLRPAFLKDGSVTAGNASGINDGAAALLIMSGTEARKRNLTPLARISSWATAGVDPALMGTGPIPATRKALKKAGWNVGDIDLIEANEAFAAQALAVCHELDFDPSKVNVNGGAIALGHPIGASGARVLTTLVYEMSRRRARRGLATLCIGGGMGVAIAIEGL